MIATKKICLFFALFLIIGATQVASKAAKGEGKEISHEDLLPLMLLMRNGAISMAAPGVCLLSMLSLGAVYLFSQRN